MGKAQYFLTLLIVNIALGGPAVRADEAADIDKWIEQLGSEDFDTREAAARELGKRAEKIWDRLEKLSKGDNTDVRTLARRAMGDAGKRAVKKTIDDMNAEMAALEKKVQDASAATTPLLLAISTAEEAEKDAVEKRIIDTNDATKAAEAAATKAKNEAVARYTRAREDLVEKQKTFERERHARASRAGQLKYLLETNEIILPSEVAAWKPDKLPFDKKLKCSVTFEFVDKPLADALKDFKAMCGLTVELDPAVRDAPTINLRVTDMCADLSLEWICKLADVEKTIDVEGKKVIVHKPKR